MTNQKGSISIHTENIFPIIKKWLYSDKDIFIRELISNGCDAVNKYKKLISLGEAQGNADEHYKIKVSIDKENSALIFEDNGIGMTAEEVEKYINQVAFSGAEDFFNTYKDKMNEENDIIGHFGLGFYSSFMVSKKVQIDTLSYKENATPVRWVSEDGLEFELTQSDNRETRGTTITLFLADDSKEFLEEYTVRNIIDKYCSFLPVDIYLETIKTEEDEVVDTTPINDTNPLWLKAPKDCTDEEYKEFYRKVFKTFDEPLFWIHLNVDYPFNLKGILYFPKLKNEFELIEGKVKLYNNQVFVADNIKEVIPEFLLLLKGVIDCPDLPLNVSRSFLQNDRDVSKISKHIVKKVADKLKSLYKNERENYEKFYKSFGRTLKFGVYDNFGSEKEVLQDLLMFYSSKEKKMVTLDEYITRMTQDQKYIYYAVGESIDKIEKMPQTEILLDKGYEILYFTDDIDEFAIKMLMKYKEKEFKSVSSSDLGINTNDEETEAETANEENKKLFDAMKDILNNKVSSVKISNKLKNHPVCLSNEGDLSIEMEKVLNSMPNNQDVKAKKVLEINIHHNVFNSLKDAYYNDKDKLNLYTNLLYNQALLIEGLSVSDPVEFTNDICKLMK